MTSSTLATIFTSGVDGLTSYFSTLFPVILPVAIGIAILFGIFWWIRGASRRRF